MIDEPQPHVPRNIQALARAVLELEPAGIREQHDLARELEGATHRWASQLDQARRAWIDQLTT